MEKFANFIAIACVLHFCWSYYWNCYRKGFSMDFWHFSLLYNLFVIHIMLPFSRSDLNIFALGPGLLRRAQDHVTQAYLISAFGYICILIGGSLWRVHLGLGLRGLFSRVIEFPVRGSLLLLRSKGLLIVHGLVVVTMMAAVLIYYFSVSGFGFNLRGLIIVTPALRPIAQFVAFYSVLIGSNCLVRFYQYREFSMGAILLLIVAGLLFFGERSNIAALAMMTVVVMFIQKGRRLKLISLTAGIVVALFFVFFLDALRRPNFSLRAMLGGSLINMFYGNSFSDTRDFALILSFWDGHLLLGKTYLAGLFAFVPRFLSTFRDTWAIGVVTATMAGFSPKEHPGLRVGIVGEAYLNFGIAGVALLGLFVGAGARLIDLRMKQSVATLPPSDLTVYSYYIMTFLIGTFENSVVASTFYTVLLVLLVSWMALKASRLLKLSI